MTLPTRRPLSRRERAATAIRYLLLTAVLIGAAGIAGRLLSWPLLTATIGPTAYVFAAHPLTETARLRNAVVGHAVAIGAGLGALWVFGLLHRPAEAVNGSPTFAQIGAAAVAAGLTMLLLELAGSHHAPAAATALLVATGLAKPGPPLIGLVLGLAIVIVLGPLCGRWTFARRASARDQARAVEPVPPPGPDETAADGQGT